MEKGRMFPVLAALLTAVFHLAQGQCPCYKKSPGLYIEFDQNKYCSSDFVIEATVTKISRDNKFNPESYTIAVKKTIKMPKKANKKVLLTSTDSQGEGCGVKTWHSRNFNRKKDQVIKEGETYYFTGKGKGKSLYLDQCTSIIVLSSDASAEYVAKLKGGFPCGCQIKGYEKEASEVTQTNSNCITMYQAALCYSFFNMCSKKGNKCQWTANDNPQFANCYDTTFFGRTLQSG